MEALDLGFANVGINKPDNLSFVFVMEINLIGKSKHLKNASVDFNFLFLISGKRSRLLCERQNFFEEGSDVVIEILKVFGGKS